MTVGQRKRRATIVSFILMIVATAAGCSSRESPRTATVIESAERDVAALPQIATAAKDELHRRLSGVLMKAMSDGGPAAAIPICSRKARELADQVGKELGVRIGRTSFQLRNAANAPPEWAQPLVLARTETAQFEELPAGLGALFPIHLKSQCLVCHGPPEKIPDDVRRQLATTYPDDAATGFQDGQLRGWFWVEVPRDRS